MASPTLVTVTPEDGKFRVTGTMLIHEGTPNETPWPINLLFNTEAEANHYINCQGWTIQS